MRKLISILVAAVFAVSSGMVLAQATGGAKPAEKKEETKKEAKKGDKKAAPKKAAPKKDASKKDASKKAAKTDEMKK